MDWREFTGPVWCCGATPDALSTANFFLVFWARAPGLHRSCLPPALARAGSEVQSGTAVV